MRSAKILFAFVSFFLIRFAFVAAIFANATNKKKIDIYFVFLGAKIRGSVTFSHFVRFAFFQPLERVWFDVEWQSIILNTNKHEKYTFLPLLPKNK